jgi:hypothetical protein
MKAENFPTSGLLERMGPGSKALSSYNLPQTEERHELFDQHRSFRSPQKVSRLTLSPA